MRNPTSFWAGVRYFPSPLHPTLVQASPTKRVLISLEVPSSGGMYVLSFAKSSGQTLSTIVHVTAIFPEKYRAA